MFVVDECILLTMIQRMQLLDLPNRVQFVEELIISTQSLVSFDRIDIWRLGTLAGH